MNIVEDLEEVVSSFTLYGRDDASNDSQLFAFAEKYANLSPKEADELRSKFDAKYRLKVFTIASLLLNKKYDQSSTSEKERLLAIFFASYSFDNLGFGYDSVRYVIDNENYVKEDLQLSRVIWGRFKNNTTNHIAFGNIENRFFRKRKIF
jgi:hypothetical protein